MSRFFGAAVRFLTYPLRLAIVRFPRGHFLRNVSIYLLKKLRSHAWLEGAGVFSPLDAPQIQLEASDSLVIRKTYWLGVQGYEGILGTVWMRLCAQSRNVLEVGGNIGLYSCLGGKTCVDRYTVLEPIPEIAAQIRRNLTLNGLAHVELIEAAATPHAVQAQVQMQIPDEGVALPLGAQLVSGSEVAGRRADRTLCVNGLPFRELVRHRDLIKIDAEGIEYGLLHSATAELSETRPTLLVEVLPDSEKLAELIAELARQWNYRIYVVPAYRSDQPVEIPWSKFHAKVPGQYFSMDVVLTGSSLQDSILGGGGP